MLRIEIETRCSQVTLHCSGRLVLGLEAETLRCVVNTRTEQSLCVDLSGIRSADAAGLGLLVELQRRAKENGKTFSLKSPSRSVCRLLSLMKLNEVMEIVGSAKAADAEDTNSVPQATRRSMTA